MEDHWTRDAELLERFVRGALTTTERQALEEHLQGCLPCRDAVENERTLAAGIRRAGRSDLRARLRRRIDARAPAGTPWPLVLRVAAVIAIVAGIAVSARWLTVTLRPDQDTPTIADLKKGDTGKAESEGLPLREESSPLMDSDGASAARTSPAKEPLAVEKDRGKRRVAQEAPAPAGRTESHAAAADTEMGAQKYAVQHESAPAPGSTAERPARSDSAPTPLIVVRTPRLVGEALSAEGTQELPCLAEVRGDTLVVRVLRSPPAGAGDGDPLEAELIGTDSLILRFADMTLGLKLPRAFPGGIRLLKTR